jgi:hypothetical protein
MSDQPTPKPKKVGFTAPEIMEQVEVVKDAISHGKRPYQIRAICAERWGLAPRTAELRMQTARRLMVTEMEGIDRKEFAAQAMQTLLKVQEMSLDTRQGSNAIGATRLLMELAGILGRSA